MLNPTTIFKWSSWHPLRQAPRARTIPATPGLYRIRRTDRDDLDYIGQTGSGTMNLRKRLAMLRGIYGPDMPYRDPHTAGPALWALRHRTGCDFEVSVMSVDSSTPWRKGLEALAIALYRVAYQCSPTVNFGRMPAGYRMSSGNTATLVRAGKRYTGSYTGESTTSHLASISPTGSLHGDHQSLSWCGHTWSTWCSLQAAFTRLNPQANGLYRIKQSGTNQLLYIGEGLILSRLKAHLKKTFDANHVQGAIFHSIDLLECSWVINTSWVKHERLELENDLIGSYILMTEEIPQAQFIG